MAINIEKQLETILTEKLQPLYLAIINESNQHAGPNRESHFKIVIVSDKFIDMAILQRHRLVNSYLADFFSKVHAVSLNIYTNEQWQKRQAKITPSPKCAKK